MTRHVSLPLFWRVCLTNGAVFALGTLALVLSPATVSARPILSEVVVVVVGMAVIVVVNSVLLGSLLRPLDRLAVALSTVDPRETGRRLEAGRGPARPLVSGFNEMLDRLEEERTVSTARALHAQEAERQRIAQELHDEVGQSLTAVLLGLTRAIERSGEDVAADLVSARDTTRTSLAEVRRISQRLRPGVLADLGLVNALSSLASDLAARTGVRVERTFAPGLPPLGPESELVVYRVAQEALTNVARHAGAGRVELGLTKVGDRLELRVADDGAGVTGHQPGTGMQGMRERAQLVGGTLALSSPAGGGTVLVLAVPLPSTVGDRS